MISSSEPNVQTKNHPFDGEYTAFRPWITDRLALTSSRSENLAAGIVTVNAGGRAGGRECRLGEDGAERVVIICIYICIEVSIVKHERFVNARWCYKNVFVFALFTPSYTKKHQEPSSTEINHTLDTNIVNTHTHAPQNAGR